MPTNASPSRPSLPFALLVSSGAYTVVYCAAVLLVTLRSQYPTVRGVVFFALGSGIVVAVAGLLQWPILRAMRALDRRFTIAAGAILGIVPMTALVLLLRDSDEETILDILTFWLRLPGEFLLSFLPMALAGALLAWFATSDRVAAAG